MKKKSLTQLILTFLLILLSFLGINFYQDEQQTTKVEVLQIIDGDTILVKDLQTGETFKVRYLGIDTPELEGDDYKTCFSQQAKERNEELVSDKVLTLKFDADKYDQYGRTLAYAYAQDETFVNLKLIEEGYARFYLDKQNTLYQNELSEASLIAQEEFKGLWGLCGEEEFNNECVIKGNIDRLGNKYYHLPDDKYYSQTEINPLKEDQWLCTIEEAEAKNFKRALK